MKDLSEKGAIRMPAFIYFWYSISHRTECYDAVTHSFLITKA
jgi:hypothetical protein